MIFVYSSTGNSLQLAKEIADMTGDEVVDILDTADGHVDVTGYDVVGFVTPVYFFDMPRILRAFIDRLVVREGQRFFMVFTCGTTPDRACRRAIGYFRKRGMDLSHVFSYRMPENYIALFSPPKPDVMERMLDHVPEYAREVVCSLDGAPCVVSRQIGLFGLLTLFGNTAYDILRGTKGLHVDDGCTSCGLCARLCPDSAIVVGDSGPVWVNRKCQHCMACINRCPMSVIQYKRGTKRRARYVNPRVRMPGS